MADLHCNPARISKFSCRCQAQLCVSGSPSYSGSLFRGYVRTFLSSQAIEFPTPLWRSLMCPCCAIWGSMQRYAAAASVRLLLGSDSRYEPRHLERLRTAFLRLYNLSPWNRRCFFRDGTLMSGLTWISPSPDLVLMVFTLIRLSSRLSTHGSRMHAQGVQDDANVMHTIGQRYR